MEEKKIVFIASSEEIQAKLDKRLGPEYISKRIGHGSTRVAYIEGWKAINLANQIFGYNGWSSEVKSVTVDFMDEKQGRFTIGCTAIVRVTLSDGAYREDIGYGTVENERRKSAAFERAKKSAVTDALKRSLRGFGNALGNCLYDKDFLSKIDKVKFEPPDFDEGNLFRIADELSEISKSNTISVHSGDPVAKKRAVLHTIRPEPVVKPIDDGPEPQIADVRAGLMSPTVFQGNFVSHLSPVDKEQEDLLDDSFMFSDELQDDDLINIVSTNKSVKNCTKAPPNHTSPVPATFVTAKAAENLQNKNLVPPAQLFNPKFQAQSIKHTVDQTTSSHVSLSILKEKGIDQSRESIYSKFAPKGKLIGNSDTFINLANGIKKGLSTTTRSPQLLFTDYGNTTNNNSLSKSSDTNVSSSKLIQRKEPGGPN